MWSNLKPYLDLNLNVKLNVKLLFITARRILIWTAVLILFSAGSVFLLNMYRAGWFWPVKPVVHPPELGDRILIVAPHPDDEALATAGIIQNAVKLGKTVKIVLLTNGDGYRGAVVAKYHTSFPTPEQFQGLGIERHEESTKALGLLGVPAENIVFLGYPDGGLMKLWESSWDQANPYQGRTGYNYSPYVFSYEKNVPYAGENVVKNLVQIIDDFNPTDMFYPDGNDQHNDHWAGNAFVQYAAAITKYSGHQWRYLVHLGEFPWPWHYTPGLPLQPPEAMKELNLKWMSYRLNREKVLGKKAAVEQYVTQTKTMGPYMKGFIRRNELFIINEMLWLTEKGRIAVGSPASNKVFTNNYVDAGWRATIEGKTIKTINVDKNGSLFAVGLETRGMIKASTLYKLNLRFFRGSEVKRLDLEVLNNGLSAQLTTSQSIELPRGAVLHVDDNQIRVELPVDLLQGVDSLLLFGEIKQDGKRLDKTTCSLIRLSQGSTF